MTTYAPEIGTADDVGPMIRRILAPNPSPMTYLGTNTYLLGTKHIAVFDPGPRDDRHLSAILDAVGHDARVTHIFVTHSHLDHSPLASELADETGAQIHAFGRSKDGQSDFMRQLEQNGYDAGGEGIDHTFSPDVYLSDGAVIEGKDWTIRAIHTPGHMSNHMCFAAGKHAFSGDHVMDWATSMVSPPDGDLSDFMTSCRKLLTIEWDAFYPGHGDIVRTPNDRIKWLIDHRCGREREIEQALQNGPNTARAIAEMIYTDIDPRLIPAATRNVFAHLLDLSAKGLITFEKPLSADSIFSQK